MEFSKSSDSSKKTTKKLTAKIVQCLLIPFMIVCSIISKFTGLRVFVWAWHVFQVFLLWLTADLITGIIHWWEDAYGNPKWPILGKYVVEPNLTHHKEPHKLLEGSYWTRINTSVFAAVGIAGVLWLFGLHSWQMIVCLLFCTQGNEIHAMSHRPDKLTGRVVRLLQETGIFQSKKMHRWHHRAPYETNFCIMTDFLNPILNKIGFWRKLEWSIFKLFKIDVLRASPIRHGL
jgi:ubiquitin-conjugating enzyme E2 variant